MINRFLQVSLLVFTMVIALCPFNLAAADSLHYFTLIERDLVPVAEKEYYLRHSFMHEKGVHSATNYWRGMLTPINTRVYLVEIGEKTMTLRLGSGETVRVDNVPNFTRTDMATIAKRMLSYKPVPIERFDKVTVAAIKNGVMKIGMSKAQVVMARGYPPAHETPSLELDTWKYWSSRFVTQSIVFANGALVRGRGIQ